MTSDTRKEEFRINGGKVWAKIKDLVKAGNRRHLVLKNKEDGKILSMTVTIAVIIAILAPQIVIILTLIALALHCNIVIEREVQETTPAQ